MKVRSAIKALCKDCYVVKRGKHRFVYCKKHPKHKQRQGFHSQASDSYCMCCGMGEQIGVAVDQALAANSSLGAIFPSSAAMQASRLPMSSFTSSGGSGFLISGPNQSRYMSTVANSSTLPRADSSAAAAEDVARDIDRFARQGLASLWT
jgi:ribosomal protein L36